jgi:death-on-curing protein
MKLLSAEDVLIIREKVINKNELQGLAGNKSLEALVDRIGNRIRYGMIGDVYDLAATHAVVIAVGHAFNDANKRTAFVSMDACLEQNGIILEYDVESVGNMIIRVAEGLVGVPELAHYLRSL